MDILEGVTDGRTKGSHRTLYIDAVWWMIDHRKLSDPEKSRCKNAFSAFLKFYLFFYKNDTYYYRKYNTLKYGVNN